MMLLLFRISVQSSVGPLICPSGLQLIARLSNYWCTFNNGVYLSCFDRSVYSHCALCNKTWLMCRKAFFLFQQ